MLETIGLQLKQAREAKNLTIQKVVQATHIRARYIESIEADDFESLPSPIQARAFLRLYAEFLGISLGEAIARQREGIAARSATPTDLPPFPSQLSASANYIRYIPVLAKTPSSRKILNRFLNHIRLIVNRLKGRPKAENSGDLIVAEVPNEPEKMEKFFLTEETPDPNIEILPSQAIFTKIGKALHQRRESLSLSLDEIELHTHVRNHYLVALEAGEFAGLPSSVQARGMLSNYAHFLNLDVDEILLSFADGLQTQLLERHARSAIESDKRSSKFPNLIILPSKIKVRAIAKRYISVDIIVGGGLVLLLLTFAIWGTSRIINMRTGSTPQPTMPPLLSILNLSTEPATFTPEQVTTENVAMTNVGGYANTLAVTLPAAGSGPVQVVIIAQNPAYVRVTVDGKVQFEGRVTAGTAYPYDGNNQIEVLTGNGRAISILYNQNNLGPMGDIGEVVDHIYTTNAILNPTTTFTPTPTKTPTPTITLRPSPTLRPSVTPRLNIIPRSTQTPDE